MLKRYHLQDPAAHWLAGTVYGADKRDALRRYRLNFYPGRERLPRGISIWES